MINFDKWDVYLNTSVLFSSLMTSNKDTKNDYARVKESECSVYDLKSSSPNLVLFISVF